VWAGKTRTAMLFTMKIAAASLLIRLSCPQYGSESQISKGLKLRSQDGNPLLAESKMVLMPVPIMHETQISSYTPAAARSIVDDPFDDGPQR
jgi:hypothetical protein